ncbi:MAG: peptidylprolyl isomerase [Planctomycetes bacterium]|nr:peptidylprolyl isomerase [Planctomycetota bacterium]
MGCGSSVEPEQSLGKKLVRSPKELDLPNTQPAPESYQVKLETSKGDVVIEVTRKWAPLAADRFYTLVKCGFYNDCRFFHVIYKRVAQCGINGDPRVSAEWNNTKFDDEPVKQSNLRGTVTFAKSPDPNTRSTQFFINYLDNTAKDEQGFAPFGRVVKGMDVVLRFFKGYGELPQQELIARGGNAYLQKNFPKLDYIKTATILSPENGGGKKSGKSPAAGKSPQKSKSSSSDK